MSELREISCPGCGKRFCYKSGLQGKLRLTCPGCARSMTISPKQSPPAVSSPTVVATPIMAKPLAGPPTDFQPLESLDSLSPVHQEYLPEVPSTVYQRPAIKSLRPSKKSASGPSPQALAIIGLSIAGVILLGLGGFVVYQVLRSFEGQPLAMDQAVATDQSAAVDTGPENVGSEVPADEAPTTATPPSTDTSSLLSKAPSSNRSDSELERVSQPPASGSAMPVVAATPSQPSSSFERPSVSGVNEGSNTNGSPTEMALSSGSSPATVSTEKSSDSLTLADVIERAEQSVVRIEVSMADGKGLGSGFVVDDQGTLITNCHVLAGASGATAYFPDGRSCMVLGTLHIDPSRDIVVAKIADKTAPPLTIAASLPRKGEHVTALGAPHGLSFTATNGIVSALRPGTELGDEHRGTWIQVDAPLSPGNSGGPLINSVGDVIGMSTLASQGSAQNLNFGISSEDIREAISLASSAALKSLELGVAKVEMREPGSSRPGSSRSGADVLEAKISDDVMAAYVRAGVSDFAELSRGLRNESTRLSAQLKEMRKGKSFIPAELRSEDVAIARVTAPGQRTAAWFFLNEEVKRTAIDRQQARIKVCNELKNQINSPEDGDSLFALLWNYGPKLDMRRNQSIGFVDELIVVHALNEHEVLAVLDETPVILWAPATTGMSAGEILEGPVYVSGTVTAALRSGITASVTVLQLLTEEQLRQGVEQSLGGGYRTWTDRTGRSSFEAKLLGSDNDKVVLQNRDGKIYNVPRERLSDADLEWLANHP